MFGYLWVSIGGAIGSVSCYGILGVVAERNGQAFRTELDGPSDRHRDPRE